MLVIKLIFKSIMATIAVIIGYPFLIIMTPLMVIFWSSVSHKVKKGFFAIIKMMDSKSQPKDIHETEVGDEKISDAV